MMGNRAWEDLDVFLSEKEFAVAAVVRLGDGSSRLVRGIFDDPYLNAEAGEYELDTAQPRLTCKWADVRDVRRGDTLEVEGRVYDVVTHAQADGTGMAILALAEQCAND